MDWKDAERDANGRRLLRSKLRIGAGWLVCSRTPVPPLQFFDAALRYVDAIKTLVTLLPALSAATKSEGAAVRKDTRRSRPLVGDNMVGNAIWADLPQRAPSRRPKSSFSELAEHLRNVEA